MILYPSGLLITDFGTIEDGVLLALVVLSRAAGKKMNVLKVTSNYILKMVSFMSGQKNTRHTQISLYF